MFRFRDSRTTTGLVPMIVVQKVVLFFNNQYSIDQNIQSFKVCIKSLPWFLLSSNRVCSGVWRQYDGTFLSWTPWWSTSPGGQGHPNGGKAKNCAEAYFLEDTYAGQWSDEPCSKEFWYICERDFWIKVPFDVIHFFEQIQKLKLKWFKWLKWMWWSLQGTENFGGSLFQQKCTNYADHLSVARLFCLKKIA